MASGTILIIPNVRSASITTMDKRKFGKKHIVTLLLIVGIILLCISIVLAVLATGSKNIIGGADLATFLFVFFYEKNGLYASLAFWGFAVMITALVVGIKKRI